MADRVFNLYKIWATDPYFSDFHKELEAIADDPAAIRERFYKELDFGTAGIRGIMGAGINRINIHLVRKVSTAVSRYIRSLGAASMKRGVVIGYDSRNLSKDFAREAASVFAGHGIKVYIHDDICPVPVLSYSVRELKTSMGIMITASHNPKEYNGYKVYGPDGAQLSPEDSEQISARMKRIADYRKMKIFSFESMLGNGTVSYCPAALKKDYLGVVRALIPENSPADSDLAALKVVYTPLHGAGAGYVPEILAMIGTGEVRLVEKQMIPDGNFPTVSVPNPENAEVYGLALAEAKISGADIILATDPDSDRTGAYVRNREGGYELLSGNEIGEILLKRRIGLNTHPKPFAVSTLVSTRLSSKICKADGVRYVDVLTGFKFIGEQIRLLEENEGMKFIFGFEESYGYLAGSYCRDKDAVASCMLLCEACAFYKKQGMTIPEALDSIYAEAGAEHELQTSLVLKGEEGSSEMKRIMTEVRKLGAGVLAGEKPVFYMDLLENTRYDVIKGGKYRKSAEDRFPPSDVLYYSYDGFWFCLRPSGTEPKIKIYFGAGGKNRSDAAANAADLRDRVMKTIKSL